MDRTELIVTAATNLTCSLIGNTEINFRNEIWKDMVFNSYDVIADYIEMHVNDLDKKRPRQSKKPSIKQKKK